MEWNVKNAVSRDVERQHLNKILSDIKSTVDSVYASSVQAAGIDNRIRSTVLSMLGSGLAPDPTTGGVVVTPKSFYINLVGDVTGSGRVINSSDVTITAVLDPSLIGVSEAPSDGLPYWRQDATWQSVPYAISSLANIFGDGFATYSDANGWVVRLITATVGDIDVVNGDGLAGDTLLTLSNVPDVGGGTLQKTLFDSKGRKIGTSAATTDDLPQGTVNLYFPEAPINGISYARRNGAWTPVSASFIGLSDTPNSYTGQAGKAVTVNSGEMGLEFTESLAQWLAGLKTTLIDAPNDAAAIALGVPDGGLYRNGSVLMIVVNDSDPYWSNVSALLHMNGANGSTTFTDETGKIWTPSGNAQISTTAAKFGQSLFLDGTGDWIDGPSSADFTFGTGDFTLECFANFSGFGANRAVIGLATNYTLYASAGGFLFLYDGTFNILSGPALSANVWYHLAICRSSGTIRMFVNGVAQATALNSMNMTSSNMRVGAAGNGTSNMFGYIDEVRITKGVARYVGNFVPPTAEFPNS